MNRKVSREIFVGRERELSILYDEVKSIHFSKGKILMVQGEPGVGKTYFVERLIGRLKFNVDIYRARGEEFRKDDSYYILRILLINILNLQNLTPEETVKTLESFFNQNIIISFIKPYIKWILNLPLNKNEEIVVNHLADSDKQNVSEGSVLNLFRYLSEKTPILFFIDDVHWADRSTVLFLLYLTREIADKKMAVILTSPFDFDISPISAFKQFKSVNLSNFSPEEVENWLKQITNSRKTEKKLIEFLIDRSEGNPFYLTEFFGLMSDRGFLKKKRETLQYKDTFKEIPGKISQIILTRFSKLSEPEKSILKKGSISGISFTDIFLKKMGESGEINRNLLILCKKGFVCRIGEQDINDEKVISFRFKHSTIKDVIYNSVDLEERKDYHKQTYQILKDESLLNPETDLDSLAYHCRNAGLREEYYGYLFESARRKIREFRLEEAEDNYRNLISDGFENPELLSDYANLFYKRGKFDKSLELYEKIFRVSNLNMDFLIDTKLSEINVLLKTAQYRKVREKLCGIEKTVTKDYEHSRKQYELFELKGDLYMNEGNYKKAGDYFRRSMELKREIFGDNDINVAESYNSLGVISRITGDYEKAENYLMKCLEIRTRIYGDKHPEISAVFNNLGLVYWNMKRYVDAKEYLLKSLSLKQMFGENHYSVASVYNNLGALSWKILDFTEAGKYYKKALGIWKLFYDRNHPNIATAYYNIGLIHIIRGQYKEALKYQEKALSILLRTYKEDNPSVLKSIITLGTVHLYLGDIEKSLNFFNKALEIRKEMYGIENKEYADSLVKVSECLVEKRRYGAARRNLISAEKILKAFSPRENPQLYFRINYLCCIISAENEKRRNCEKSIKKLNELLEILKDDPLVILNTFDICKLYLDLKLPEAAEVLLNSFLPKIKKINNKPYLITGYLLYSEIFRLKNEKEKAFQFADKAFKIGFKLGYEFYLGEVYSQFFKIGFEKKKNKNMAADIFKKYKAERKLDKLLQSDY